jgi:hypothetical protein
MAPWKDMVAGTMPASTGVPELTRLANLKLDEFWANQK